MMRMIQIQGPVEAIDAVQAVGREDLLYFQDYFWDKERTYSALLVIFNDAVETEGDVLSQVRTLLAQKGVARNTFWISERFIWWPDAMPSEWYQRMERDFTGPLMALEKLGVRDEAQQAEMERLREEVRYRVAGSEEVAEANIKDFGNKINTLLGQPVDNAPEGVSWAPSVGKYEGLWVLENSEGKFWSVAFDVWVSPDSNEFTSWSDSELEAQGLDADDLDQLTVKYNLPDGEWVNINEA